MRLTSDEIVEITKHLVSVLRRKRFNVATNRYGIILFAEKFGIRCCPAINNSVEDGRHGFGYIQLVTNPYSPKDLGSYYKPRTDKSKHVLFDKNNSVDKYAGNEVHIDMHNYQKVIEKFADDLNKDYARITRLKTEDLEIMDDNSGSCTYRPSKHTDDWGIWIISADNQELKTKILDCLKGLAERSKDNSLGDDVVLGIGFSVDEILDDDYLDYFAFVDCVWRISEPYENNVLFLVARPGSGVPYDEPRTVNLKHGGEEILAVIEDWVKEHPNNEQKHLSESLVKIKDTNTVFDGMTGTIESENGDRVTVMVDFNQEHKVRNTFKREQIEILED